MKIQFTVDIEIERIQGKMVTKDELADEILESIEAANPSSLSGLGPDSNSEYEITDYVVERTV